jgi:hypothetical protein
MFQNLNLSNYNINEFDNSESSLKNLYKKVFFVGY